ncbi:hypothetical protein BOO30_11030 [Vibrio navarrensis]|nr:hypothetical protein [Vibrio navarrensis]MBE4596934.1 hypothetical protein [Vibrio navarrensis]
MLFLGNDDQLSTTDFARYSILYDSFVILCVNSYQKRLFRCELKTRLKMDLNFQCKIPKSNPKTTFRLMLDKHKNRLNTAKIRKVTLR